MATNANDIVWDAAPAVQAAPAAPQINWDNPKNPGNPQPPMGASNDVGAANPAPVPPASAPAAHDVGAPGPFTGAQDVGVTRKSDAEIIKGYGGDPAKVMKEPQYQPGVFSEAMQGDYKSAMSRFMNRFQDPITALHQMIQHAPGQSKEPGFFDIMGKIENDKYQQTKPPGADTAGAFGNIAGTMAAVPNIPGLGGAIATGVMGGLAQPTNPDESDFWGTKGQQGAIGGAFGGVTHGVLGELGKQGKTTLSQASEAVAAHNPQNLSASLFNDASKLVDEQDLNGIRAIANNPMHPRAGAAQKVLDDWEAASHDMPHVMQTDLGMQALKAKIATDAKAALRNKLAEGVTVKVDQPMKVLDDIIADATGPNASKWTEADKQNMIPELKKLRDALAKTKTVTETPIGGMTDQYGNPLTKIVEKETPNTFQGMTNTRTGLRDTISDYYKSNNAVMGKRGAANLQRVENSLDYAMHDAAQNSGKPELAAADVDFRKSYATMSKTFRDREIVGAMTDTNPDAVLPRFDSGSRDRAQKLYNTLGPVGHAAAMSGMADAGVDAMTKAGGDLNAFRTAMNARSKAIGVFFHGNDATKMNGIRNLASVTKTLGDTTFPAAAAGLAGTAAAFSPLGQHEMATVLSSIVGAGAGAGIGFGGGAKLSRNMINWMLTSKQSSDFLAKLGGLTPGSSTFYRFVQNQLPRVIANYKSSQVGNEKFNQAMNPPPQPSPVALPGTPNVNLQAVQ